MCCRKNQPRYVSYQSRQRGCCSSQRQRQVHQITPYYSPLGGAVPIEPQAYAPIAVNAPYPELQSGFDFPHVRGPFSMAAALILGLSLGAQKIQEKREKKKEKKALMEFANEQREAKLRKDRSSRKSEEARSEERRRSESLERDEVPPPSYEDAVGESAYQRGR
ncbi:uncharacterized protein CC84DRAFT_1167329 [Paraphaeosphaeria sporulosa]|uniref:Uncharacterized protein n=1 Tax=Paraphaeosphaeria sporulosa TaxID=1460663 RepID=A0A177C693_9PLEO|nr:uncharacterized protein CC84DRAFT_1167329 [Paraphaeosphaeria sporulosa]OAG02210.1 hypothetical protein CC84DRAFT_1167329 [Paraphaeosphaeria sporulosa]